jgi:hypothetical protein
MFVTNCRASVRMQQIPNKHKRVVAAGGEHASPRGVPLDTVEGSRMSTELEECLPGLPHVKNADNVRILGKGGKEVRVVRGGSETE